MISTANPLSELKSFDSLGDSIHDVHQIFSRIISKLRQFDETEHTSFAKGLTTNIEKHEQVVNRSNTAAVELSVLINTYITLVKNGSAETAARGADLSREVASLQKRVNTKMFDPTRDLTALRNAFHKLNDMLSANARKRETALGRQTGVSKNTVATPTKTGPGLPERPKAVKTDDKARPEMSFFAKLLGWFCGNRGGRDATPRNIKSTTSEKPRNVVVTAPQAKNNMLVEEAIDLPALLHDIQDIEQKLEAQIELFRRCFQIQDELKKVLAALLVSLKTICTNAEQKSASRPAQETESSIETWQHAAEALERYAKRMKY